MVLITLQSLSCGQQSAEAVPVLFKLRQLVEAGQHQSDGNEEPHDVRPLDVHASRPSRPKACAASTAATSADVAGTVEDMAQTAASFCNVERPMTII